MEILFYVLIAIGAIVALFFIFKLLGGCLLKVLLGLAVLAAVALLVYYLVGR
jgi:hypothetical protein